MALSVVRLYGNNDQGVNKYAKSPEEGGGAKRAVCLEGKMSPCGRDRKDGWNEQPNQRRHAARRHCMSIHMMRRRVAAPESNFVTEDSVSTAVQIHNYLLGYNVF
jgi:hypothetical protein